MLLQVSEVKNLMKTDLNWNKKYWSGVSCAQCRWTNVASIGSVECQGKVTIYLSLVSMFTITKELHGTKLTWQSENFSCSLILHWSGHQAGGLDHPLLLCALGTEHSHGRRREQRGVGMSLEDLVIVPQSHAETALISKGRMSLVPPRAGDTWHKLVLSLLIPGTARCFGRTKAVRNPRSSEVIADNRYLQTVKCLEFFSTQSKSVQCFAAQV